MEHESKVIPPVKGALGTTHMKLKNWLKKIGIETEITELQKLSFYTLLKSSKRFLRFKKICCYWTSKKLIHC